MSWRHILGHDHQRHALANASKRGRLAHAYLFAGEPGIGKRLFAMELSKALLCENAHDDLTACDRCGSCVLMTAGNHPDFFSVAKPADKHELPVDEVRELCRRFMLKPARGRGKIGLLDNADDMNDQAANSFLKTLEEPPPRSVFFLIGTTPERQLPTVVSRCQVIPFAPLADELVAGILRQSGITDAALMPHLLRLGRGSPGQAMALADPQLWVFRATLITDLMQPRPDSVALSKKVMEFVTEVGKDSAAQRQRAGNILRILISFFEDALSISIGVEPRLGDPGELTHLRKLADRADPEKLMQIVERCLEADSQTDRYVQLVLVLEGLMDALGVSVSAG